MYNYNVKINKNYNYYLNITKEICSIFNKLLNL